MKARFLAAGLAIFAMAARAYWVDTPVEELAARSDCVVIGTVKQLTFNTNTHRLIVTMDDLLVLKGDQFAGRAVTFDAPATLMHCVVTSFIGQPQPSFNSFATNDLCAVFLVAHPESSARLSMMAIDDGKFMVDWREMRLHKAVSTSVTNYIAFKVFEQKVRTSPERIPASVPPTPSSVLTNGLVRFLR